MSSARKTQQRWQGDDYASHSGGQARWGLSNLEQLNLKPGDSVLDIGCGDGKISREIAGLCAPGEVIGVDFSASMIEHAKATHLDQNQTQNQQLQFEVLDAAALPQARHLHQRFNAVFSNSTLHWVADHGAVLDGIVMALKPRGRAFLSMGGKGTVGAVNAAIAELQQIPRWQVLGDVIPPTHYHDEAHYRALLATRPLQLESIRLRPRPMELHGEAALLGWLRTTKNYYLSAVADSEREDCLKALFKHTLEHCECRDDTILMPMVNLEVSLSLPA